MSDPTSEDTKGDRALPKRESLIACEAKVSLPIAWLRT